MTAEHLHRKGLGRWSSSQARERFRARLVSQLELPHPSLQFHGLIPLSDQTPLGALRAAHGAAVLASACAGTLSFRRREQAALVFSGHVPRQYVHHPVFPFPARPYSRASSLTGIDRLGAGSLRPAVARLRDADVAAHGPGPDLDRGIGVAIGVVHFVEVAADAAAHAG